MSAAACDCAAGYDALGVVRRSTTQQCMPPHFTARHTHQRLVVAAADVALADLALLCQHGAQRMADTQLPACLLVAAAGKDVAAAGDVENPPVPQA